MTDKRELLPCPLCGGVAHRMPPTASINDPIKDGGRLYPIVRCLNCYCEVGGNNYDETMHSAIDKWNNRDAPLDSSFNPDWDLLEATQESLREHMALVKERDDEILRLRGSLAEIREVYAGMEGFHANTATEVYQQRIIYKMHEIAVGREDSSDA